ncbi:MAG: DUF3048 domain-containing protein [Chloroflexota bacterium]
MRRLIQVTICILLATAALVIAPASAQDDDPPPTLAFELATNTPRPTLPASLNLATNTPAATHTPSTTPTATNTATATATNTPTATDTPSPTPTPNGPFIYPEGVNSLTGLPYPSSEALQRRNLLVKISNFPPVVRPQTGVNAADLVYEYEVEGGVTRFAAIYRSTAPEVVGPVRSGRLMDIELVTMHESLFAYSGASGPVQELILGQDWRFQIISPSIGDNCEEAGFCRVERPGIAFEHTLFVDTNKVWERADARGINQGYPARGFAFSEFPDAGGGVANDIFIDWYGRTSVRWQYDEEIERYQRYTDGVPHVDAADGEQLWADNLVILEVEHFDRPDLFAPDATNASLEIAIYEQGRAYLFRDGQFYQGFWRRRNLEPGSAIQLIYGDNTPMMMQPGRSWVSVVRWFGEVTVNETKVDADATAAVVIQSSTPTATVTPTATARP